MQNRRSGVRTDIDKPGRLATPDGALTWDCTLRNISARGAKLTLADHAGLPERVVLHLPTDGIAWPCRIVRRRDGDVGVLFV